MALSISGEGPRGPRGVPRGAKGSCLLRCKRAREVPAARRDCVAGGRSRESSELSDIEVTLLSRMHSKFSIRISTGPPVPEASHIIFKILITCVNDDTRKYFISMFIPCK